MKSSLRRTLSLLLVFLMIFSSISFADGSNNIVVVDASPVKVQEEHTSKLSEELEKLNVDPTEQVRIIVEFDRAPVIQTATARGIKVSEMSATSFNQLANVIETEQDAFVSSLNETAPSHEVLNRFSTVLNGVSMTVEYQDITAISGLKNVKLVSIANEYQKPDVELDMINSTQLTHSAYANQELGYTGEGLVVAIIDTGIDPTHKDMQMNAAEVDEALTAPGIDVLLANNADLVGQYFSAKVPFGYNYMDNDYEIRDLGPEASMHGMHVAGTVAANGTIKGVAPDAQVLAMKVFGNDPDFQSTFGDVIIRAIEDSVLLGADVINMSLGSTAATIDTTDPEQKAITDAAANGVIMAISAGNSATFGNPYNPYAANPDIGVVGSPGLVYESLQVASIDNYGLLYTNAVTVEGMDEFNGYGKDAFDGSFELVAVGGDKLGTPDNYEGLDVTGKIVLVSRGAYAFSAKTTWAYEAGAAGIVVYDHGLSTFYKNQGGWEVPFMKITKEDGLALEAILETQDSVMFASVSSSEVNPTTGLLSDFSSWGVTPDLGFKPDIAAPGGNIYSLANDNNYQFMSGTSMAAPHAAGGAALVQQRVDRDPMFAEFTAMNMERNDLVKNIMMNTGVPVREKYALTPVRGQGAGAMDLKAALTTQTVVTASETGLAKVNLKEVQSDFQEYTLDVRNFGNTPVAYSMTTENMIQYISPDSSGVLTNNIMSIPLDGIDTVFEVNGQVLDFTTVPAVLDEDGDVSEAAYNMYHLIVAAGETVTVTAKMDLTGMVDWLGRDITTLYENGAFIEGFIFLDAYAEGSLVFEAAIEAAEAALAENALAIEALELELEVLMERAEVALPAEIEAIKEEIETAKALLLEKQEEIAAFKATHADAVADVLELMAQIEAAEANLAASLEAFSGSRDSLVANARAFSLATIFQGNFEFIDNLVDRLQADGPRQWEDHDMFYTNHFDGAKKRDILEAIAKITDILGEYEAVIAAISAEDFDSMTSAERLAVLTEFNASIKTLKDDLAQLVIYFNSVDLEMILEDYEMFTADAPAMLADAEARLLAAKAADPQVPSDIEDLKEEIAYYEGAVVNNPLIVADTQMTIALLADIKAGRDISKAILVDIKDMKLSSPVLENAQAALALLQATYGEMDLAVYTEYMAALEALELEEAALQTALDELKEAKQVLKTEREELPTTIEEKQAEIDEAMEMIEALEEAVQAAKDGLFNFQLTIDNTPQLSVPWLGFYGEWDDAPAFDAAYGDPDEDTFWFETGYYDVMGDEVAEKGMVNAFSPNGDDVKDLIVPKVSVLRNVSDVKVSIVDENGSEVKVLALRDSMRKHYHDSRNPMFTTFWDGIFDGTANYEDLDEGTYYLRYEGTMASGAVSIRDIMLMLDITAPTVDTVAYSTQTEIFSVNALDNLSGIEAYTLYSVAGEVRTEIDSNDTGIFNMGDYDADIALVSVDLLDYAGNVLENEDSYQLVDMRVPYITLAMEDLEGEEIEPFGVTAKGDVKYFGTITEFMMGTVTVDEVEIPTTQTGDTTYTFEGTANYTESGKKSLTVVAVDATGNRVQFERWFYVDLEAATIELSIGQDIIVPEVINTLEAGTTSIDTSIFAEDNFPFLNVKVNDSVEYRVEEDFWSYAGLLDTPTNHTFAKSFNLVAGYNQVVVEVEDAAGTVTKHNYNFYVLSEGEEAAPMLDEIVVTGTDAVQALYGQEVTSQFEFEALDQNDAPYAFDVEVVWSIDGENAEIDEAGLVTFGTDASGLYTVTATSVTDDLIFGTKEVNVTPFAPAALKRVVVEGPEAITALFGQTVNKDYTAKAFDQYDVEMQGIEFDWTVEGFNVTMTDGDLAVAANASGNITVRATVAGTVYDTTDDAPAAMFGELAVVVTAATVPTPVTPNPTPQPTPVVVTINVALNETTVELEVGTEAVDASFDLDATVTGTTDNAIVWASSDETVATVDADGIVTAVAVGTTTITATRENGTQSATADVEVFLVGDEVTPLGGLTVDIPYMNGFTDGTFKPESTITRAQLAVIYTKILGLNNAAANTQKFSDVNKDHWSFGWVNAATEAGLFAGYKDGSFQPDKPLTRAELAATFTSFWKMRNITVSEEKVLGLKDVLGHWSSENIYRLYNAKVLEPTLVNYAPDAPATRGDVVVMINKLIGRQAMEVETSKFSDVTDPELMGAIEAATSMQK